MLYPAKISTTRDRSLGYAFSWGAELEPFADPAFRDTVGFLTIQRFRAGGARFSLAVAPLIVCDFGYFRRIGKHKP